MLKRFIDIIISFILLVLFSPVMLISALAVICDAGFPIFYRGARVGKDGSIFNILKFRSMVPETSKKHSEITASGDQRITRSGRFLRKWKLDEFPQFFNVLRGDMCIVGPRPESPSYVRYYTDEEKYVLNVRPGITGVIQILFRNEEQMLDVPDPEKYYIDVLMHQKLRYDLAYARYGSVMLDLMITIITVIAIIMPRCGVALCNRIIEKRLRCNLSSDSSKSSLET